MTDPDPSRCPLCGGPNACALAAPGAGPEAPCWCAPERFDRALLARIPAGAVGRACICRRCRAAGDAELRERAAAG
jgi:hypothetical protein